MFVGVFWGVLWLGAVLFNLINIKFIETLIEKSWFAIPATTLATAAALHVTDVRARLVAGIRTVVHTLLSWLLPLMTLIAVGFTLSLPFTGLAPLWATRSAASLLLTAAATLVVLINAAFQDGDPVHNRPVVLRYAELIAAVMLVPLVLIATYALWLRVAQYGWTVERIATAATIVIALLYAFGYAAAALLTLRGGVWMALLMRVNIATAFVVLAVLLGLFTPIADPARIAVNSQVARLESGTVPPNAFDFNYLRRGRWPLWPRGAGRTVRPAISAGTRRRSTTWRSRRSPALCPGRCAREGRSGEEHYGLSRYPCPAPHLRRPELEQDVRRGRLLPHDLGAKCDAFFVDLDGDGNEEVILAYGGDLPGGDRVQGAAGQHLDRDRDHEQLLQGRSGGVARREGRSDLSGTATARHGDRRLPHPSRGDDQACYLSDVVLFRRFLL